MKKVAHRVFEWVKFRGVELREHTRKLESLMTLKFYTLEHVALYCFLRRNSGEPRLYSPSYCHPFFSKMNEAELMPLSKGTSSLRGTGIILKRELQPLVVAHNIEN